MKKNYLVIVVILVVVIILGLMFGQKAVRKLRTLTGTQPVPAIPQTTSPVPNPAPTTPATSSGLVMMKTSATLGTYAVGPSGMVLTNEIRVVVANSGEVAVQIRCAKAVPALNALRQVLRVDAE